MNLQWRIALIIATFVSITGIVLLTMFNLFIRDDHARDHNKWSETLTAAIAKATFRDILEGRKSNVSSTLRRIVKDNSDIEYIVAVGFDGNLFASTFTGALPAELAQQDHRLCQYKNSRILSIGGINIRDFAYPLADNLDAHLHLGLNEDVFTRTLVKATINTALAGGSILLISILFSILSARRISRPIRQLSAAATAFGKGEALHTEDINRTDSEVRELALSLETMAREREKAHAEVQLMNDELEERVAKRTIELESAKNEAERANRAKSDFLSRMSHELRTPLNAILGFAQLMELESQRQLSADQQENVREIRHAGNHLLALINEMLDLARVEAGHMTYSMETVEVSHLLTESLSLLQPVAARRQIRMQAVGNLAHHVRADQLRLKQVLLNILSNAIKYNRENGSVRVSVTPTASDRLRFEITDEGAGLTPEEQAKLFMPFERLNADQMAVPGTGIGLALTKKLIEGMQGTVGITSTPGQGSTFWFELDAAKPHIVQAKGDAKSAHTGEAPALPSKEVLYIEDNPANMRLMKSVLSQYPHVTLLTATNPLLGLQLAEAHQPDLILLDLHLPEMNGFEAFKRLRAIPALRQTPIVAVSAEAMPREIERARELGFTDFFTKPLDIRRFVESMHVLLQEDKPSVM